MSPLRAPGRWLGHAACFTALAALSVLATAARAQSVAAPVRSAQPGKAPSLPTEPSAFREYRPFTDSPPSDWRGANDTVGRIGGWRAYAREAQAPGEPRPDQGGAAPHGGHR